ncbi:MAG: molybdopterin oxidoreductase, partial [Candidatus Latescibacterota bacterium]
MSSMNERSGYWRSLGELADTPEFRSALSREFADGAVDAPGAFTRRRFLQLMSASVALAGFSGCRWPKEKIVPYAHRPEGRLPGEALRFATSSELWGHARGLVATSYDGRPIKIDGNGQDPIGRGASSAIDQAAVLDLYDPDRGRSARRREGGGHRNVEWSDFPAWAEGRFGELRARRGAGLYFLAGPTSSEAVRMLRRRLSVEMPEAVWLEYEPLSTDHAREGARIAFGRPLRAHVDLEAARAIISLDADLFGDDPAALLHARGFAAGRAPERESGLNRLYVAESVPSTTGSMADHRIPLPPSAVGPFALSVARRLVDAHRIEAPAEIRRALEAAPRADGPGADVAQAIAEDLAANRGRSVAVAGYRQPPEVHAAAHLINALLGNLGPTVFFTADPDEERPSCFEAIR